jgi:hypothetical protein
LEEFIIARDEDELNDEVKNQIYGQAKEVLDKELEEFIIGKDEDEIQKRIQEQIRGKKS